LKDKAIYDWPFPEEVFGHTIEGIDVAILSSDSLRIMAAFAKNGELSEIQLRVFRRCREELKEILPHLNGYSKEYFQKLSHEVEKTFSHIKIP
jgi:hypothetical protein